MKVAPEEECPAERAAARHSGRYSARRAAQAAPNPARVLVRGAQGARAALAAARTSTAGPAATEVVPTLQSRVLVAVVAVPEVAVALAAWVGTAPRGTTKAQVARAEGELQVVVPGAVVATTAPRAAVLPERLVAGREEPRRPYLALAAERAPEARSGSASEHCTNAKAARVWLHLAR